MLFPENTPSDQAKAEQPVILPRQVCEATLAAFAQNPYYPKRWAPLVEKQAHWAGINYFALLWGPFWLFFRKMYTAGAIALAICIAASIAGARAGNTDALVRWLVPGVYLLVHIGAGLFGNTLYFHRARRAVTSVVNSRLPDEYIASALRDEGGFSVPAAILIAAANGFAHFMLINM